jgi:hypothetical protein
MVDSFLMKIFYALHGLIHRSYGVQLSRWSREVCLYMYIDGETRTESNLY